MRLQGVIVVAFVILVWISVLMMMVSSKSITPNRGTLCNMYSEITTLIIVIFLSLTWFYWNFLTRYHYWIIERLKNENRKSIIDKNIPPACHNPTVSKTLLCKHSLVSIIPKWLAGMCQRKSSLACVFFFVVWWGGGGDVPMHKFGTVLKTNPYNRGKQTENLRIDKYFQEFDKCRFILHNKWEPKRRHGSYSQPVYSFSNRPLGNITESNKR